MEEFTKEGDRCPKLLPCTHTVCLWCLTQFRTPRIRCPECRQPHQIPTGGPKGFPTNRYVLEILDLLKGDQGQKTASAEVETAELIICEQHQKPCVMFCLQRECWDLLCPKCPLQQHQEHNLVSLDECIKDSCELQQMKQAVSDELALLDTYQSNLSGSKYFVSKERDEVMKAIQKKTNELKSAIDRKADAMRRRIQLSSVEQMRKLDGVLQSVKAKSITGHILKLDMENRPHNNKPQAIQHIVKLKQRVANFQISSEEERNKMVDYTVTSFKPDTNQLSDFNPLGELISHRKVIEKQEESAFPQGLLASAITETDPTRSPYTSLNLTEYAIPAHLAGLAGHVTLGGFPVGYLSSIGPDADEAPAPADVDEDPLQGNFRSSVFESDDSDESIW